MRNKTINPILKLIFALALIRWIFPERPLAYVGPRALVDSIFSLGLLFVILMIAWGCGKKILDLLKIFTLSSINQFIFSVALGLGVMAYGVLALGLVGLLEIKAILIWLGIVTFFARDEIRIQLTESSAWFSIGKRALAKLSPAEKGLILLTGIILILTIIQTLTPPWGYDALMYHLQAPRLWLEEGRITLLQDMWQPNGPMTIEMLFTIGLAMESDVLAKLIHLAFSVLVFLLCFSMGKDLLGRTGGWLSVTILLGIPILPLWASLAYSEMSLALYTLLSISALILWKSTQQNALLVLAGLMMGWALGSKYTAIGSFALLGLWILWRKQKERFSAIGRAELSFALPALLIAAPWYLKNLLWSGNPIYPFVGGGPGWDNTRLSADMSFLVDGFGLGRSLLDYISLPLNLFLSPGNFSTLFGTIDFPGFLFPLVFLYPLTRRKINLDFLLGFSVSFFALWALGTQQTRFLITIYPLLSIITASIFLWFGTRISRDYLKRILVLSLAGGLVTVTLAYQVIQFIDISPTSVVLGKESKQSFLIREVFDYPSIRYVEENLEENAKLLMFWDGQGYYCDDRCIPDPGSGTRLTLLTESDPSPEYLASDLLSQGITHILVDVDGQSFFYLHDPEGRQRKAADYLFDRFIPACAKELYTDDSILLFEISCLD